MKEIGIYEDETLEELQLGDLKLIQKKHGFRFGMDSVLLADFARIKPTDSVADFGCGTGILLLLLYGRGKGKTYYGLEIQPEMAEMATRTIRLNHLEDQIQIYHSDAANAVSILGACSQDTIICNPPYGMPGRVLRNEAQGKATARHQEMDTLNSFLSAAFRCLKGKGRIYMVYPAAQMLSLMTDLQQHHLEPKRFRLVYPNAKHGANLVLLEAVKDARPRLHPMPPLMIYDQNGLLTKEMKTIYHVEEQT